MTRNKAQSAGHSCAVFKVWKAVSDHLRGSLRARGSSRTDSDSVRGRLIFTGQRFAGATSSRRARQRCPDLKASPARVTTAHDAES